MVCLMHHDEDVHTENVNVWQFPEVSIVRNIRSWSINNIISTNVLPISERNMEGHGNGSGTDMPESIRFVRNVLLKVPLFLLKKYTI